MSKTSRRVWGHILIKKEFGTSVSLSDEEEDELVFGEDLGCLRHTDEQVNPLTLGWGAGSLSCLRGLRVPLCHSC